MHLNEKTLILCIVVTLAVLASVNLTVMKMLDQGANIRELSASTSLEVKNPFTKVYDRLSEFEFDPIRIDQAVRDYWNIKMSVVRYRLNKEGQNTTILSTSCRHTAPWILVTLLELAIIPHQEYTLTHSPTDRSLIIYDNVANPRSILPKPPVESIRNFIASRPSSESILLQVDLWQWSDQNTRFYNDHHLMIHAYNGQICMYHAWQWRFNLIDWMTDAGSFESRYPMAQETFLEHFETLLAPAETEEEIRKREKSIWSIFGRTGTMVLKPGEKDGELRVEDVVVEEFLGTWLPVQIMHWPNQLEVDSSFRPVSQRVNGPAAF